MPRSAPWLLLLSFGVAACRETPVDTSWHQEAGYRWRALAVPRRGEPGFTPLDSRATGIAHRNEVADEHALANRTLLIGAGVAAGDIDGDGLPDLFFASAEQPPALYHNNGNFHFTDVTATSGIDANGLATSSAMFADMNGDGNLDLVVGTLGGPVKLWLGDGKGHFTDGTPASGITSGYAATTMTAADTRGTGALDLYVGTYKTHNALDVYPPEQRTFDRTVRRVNGRDEVLPQWRAEWRVENRPELGGTIRSQRAEPDLFYENDGHGHFTRVPMHGARFLDADGHPLTQDPDYFTLASRFYDVNGDGAPDLYVCNDFEDPDQFWLNDGRGNFRLAPWLSVRETSNTCMSVDFADIDRDGHVDVFTADMMSPALAERQRQFPTNTMLPKPPGLPHDQAQWMRNALLWSRGDGTWASIADYAGVVATDWTWGTAFLDVDLDGYEDLVAVNGHRWDVRDADTFEKIRTSVPPIPWNKEEALFPRSATRSVVYRNNGDLTFTDMSRPWRMGSDAAMSQGIALADLDGDGDMDVIVTRLDGTPMIYRNETNAPRVAVRLDGDGANRYGIGARVTVLAASLPQQTREMTAGGYYLSGSQPQLAFATGRDSLVQLEVRWRSGKVSAINNARPNRLYEIPESAAVQPPASHPQPPASSGTGLFEDKTALLSGHVHVDSVFDDFARQPLLPNKFSQLGPGVSWIDMDHDGRPDLVVGTGRGGRIAVLHNTGHGFTLGYVPGAPATKDVTTIVPVPDAHGGTLLLVGQSSYESATASEALALPSVVAYAAHGASLGAATVVAPGDSASVGPLAVADVNGDGRLDLFVGARVFPGEWPLPGGSHLYLRTADGGWTRDTSNDAVLRLGMVSAAVFTDLDGDGWPDLVMTSEFGPIQVLHNDRGHFRNVTAQLGLDGITSRWNGLSAGDFDGDGRMDLVVTSWGRNTPWTATSQRPFELVVGNFGGEGLGLLFAQRDSATGKEMPLESLERVARAVPSLTDRFRSHEAYSRATVDDILGEQVRRAVTLGATTFDNIVLLNRGDHFEMRPLPGLAQIAPAFAPVVADFNGDGHEDIFLAQNFSPTAMELPRFDAGAGLLLLGDGHGGFTPQRVAQSGIHVLGDQRGAAAADYDGDGRIDLAVSQNGAATTLWHNRGATPGLRVRLDAGPDNPTGIGAQLRAISRGVRGAVREVRSGSAYWSVDDPVTVLAWPAGSDSISVRWPIGPTQVLPVRPGSKEIRIRRPG